MLDVKYQVFISSTFSDLESERRLVTQQILNLGHIPVGMELFQAGDDSQWDYIKRRILDCDYYIVIVAGRYGSQRSEKSYTQLEYEYAVKSKIPVAAFLLERMALLDWPVGKVDPENAVKLEAFRKLCERKLVRHWRNGDDLAAKVGTALVELMRERPRTGWVRSSSVANAEALAEIARLSEERRSLQERLSAVDTPEELKLPPDVRHRLMMLNDLRGVDITSHGGSDATVLEILRSASKGLAIGVTEHALS